MDNIDRTNTDGYDINNHQQIHHTMSEHHQHSDLHSTPQLHHQLHHQQQLQHQHQHQHHLQQQPQQQFQQHHELPQQQFHQPQTQLQNFPLLPSSTPNGNNNTSTLTSSLPDPLLSSSNAQSVSMNRRRSSNTTNSPSSMDYDNKTCQFCNKQFAHKGSLGRHLDFKKGDPWHPIEQVNLIRINTSRRRSSDFSFQSIDENNNNNNNNNNNDNINNNNNNNTNLSSNGSTPILPSVPLSKVPSNSSFTKIPSNTSLNTMSSSGTTSSNSKKRRVTKKSMAISQMSTDSASGPKEKSKLRRKLRDRRIKAKILTNEWFQDLFANQKLPDIQGAGSNECQPPEVFVQLVALYLPVNEWPINSPPDQSYLNLIINRMKVRQKPNLINLLNLSFANYKILKNDVKFQLWNQESLKILKATIGNFSICDLYEIKSVIAKREQANFEEICRNDKLSAFVEVESTPNVEGDEELEEAEEEVDDDDNSPEHQQPPPQPPQEQQQQQNPQLQGSGQVPQQIHPGQNPYISQIPDVQHPILEEFGSSFDKFY